MTAVVVVGLGYVGLPLAVRAAEVGHQVVGFDTDLRRVKLLASGESYVEDVPSAQLAKVIELGKFQAVIRRSRMRELRRRSYSDADSVA